MHTLYFIGIDLAWSPRNLTGISILCYTQSTQLLSCVGVFLLQDLDDIVDVIMQVIRTKPAVIAIDAPLTVNNQTGRRDAEKELHTAYYKSHAVAHPANRERLGMWNRGIPRGEELVSLFRRYQFTENPYLPNKTQPRYLIEAFPHPAQVELFGLDRVLTYKMKKGRSYEQRISVFRTYQQHMRQLNIKKTESLLTYDVTQLKGSSLKAYEDMLDGLFCSYIAYYVWKNPDLTKVFGTLKEGHIIVPKKSNSSRNTFYNSV